MYFSSYNRTAHYCFVDFEFTPEDIHSLNFDPWKNPRSMFTHKVVGVRFTTDKESLDDDGPGTPSQAALEGEIDGYIDLFDGTLKWRRHGKKVYEIKFETDAQRVEAIRRFFGIQLTDEDAESIRGTAAEIGS